MTRSATATLPTLATPHSGNRPLRSAFSLLEVLIAMFILTVGMLGIAAAVVIGNASAMRALVADRVATVGRNGLAEVRTRQMLDPTRWLDAAGSHIVPDPDSPAGAAFCIDPLYIAAARFPVYIPGGFKLGELPGGLDMQRVTLNIAPVERIFVAQDDLNIDFKTLSRPRLLFRTQDGVLPLPRMPFEPPSGTGPLYPDYQGMYSWMVTVVPDIPRGTVSQQKYIVSVVVFRNRVLLPANDPTLEAPPERVALANMLGAGDVRLSVLLNDLQNPNGGTYSADEYLGVREGQYIMLAGQDQKTGQRSFLWYRVIATGELYGPEDSDKPFGGDANHYYRELTLAGPDWNPAWCSTTDSDGDGTTLEAQAILCSEVYGVYSQVMEPDVLSRLSSPVR